MTDRLLTEILLFLLLVALALTAGALLAGPLHLLFPALPLSSLAERGALLSGLLFSLVYVRLTMPLSAGVIGFRRPAEGVTPALLKNYAAGIGIMLVATMLLAGLGLSRLDTAEDFTPAFFGMALIKGLVAGVGASIIEEIIFRGALFTGVQQRINALWAVLLTSVLYATVHFLEFPDPDGAAHWYSGLILLPAALAKLGNPLIVDHFLTLFLLGVLLCLVRLKQGHIFGCIALHAGIILVIKFDGEFTDPAPDSHYGFLVNQFDNRLGWLTAVWLLMVIAIYFYGFYRSRSA